MNRHRLLSRLLKVLPATVIVVAGLIQARATRDLVRSRPTPDAVMMLANAGPTSAHGPRHARARGLTKRELDAMEAQRRAVR